MTRPRFLSFLDEFSKDPRYKDALPRLSVITNTSDPAYPTTDAALAKLLIEILPAYFAEPQECVQALDKELASENRLPDVYAHTKNILSTNSGIVAPNFAKLSQVKAPTLVSAGNKDMFCSMNVAKIIHQHIPSSRLHVFNDSGHFPWYEKPAEFYEVVSEFWNTHVKNTYV